MEFFTRDEKERLEAQLRELTGRRKEITERTDVYNFGATMYWLLTRQEVATARPDPNAGDEEGGGFAIAGGGSSAKLPPPPHAYDERIPAELSDLVLRCLQPNPNARYEDMHVIVRKLSKIIDSWDDSESMKAG